ncbi:MAG: hypothetical protein V4495_19905 [Pseudomonadota bacterium]
MKQIQRILTTSNIDAITADFLSDLASLGASIDGKRGVALFTTLKREKLVDGPYPNVSLFEAANRIMSDIVILQGVKELLLNTLFPFSSYTVEFGNENNNGFDIRASSGDYLLVGEAFNVAPSFFQGKKAAALKKIRIKGADATHKIIVYNSDAVADNYAPRVEDGLFHVVVDFGFEKVKIIPGQENKVKVIHS